MLELLDTFLKKRKQVFEDTQKSPLALLLVVARSNGINSGAKTMYNVSLTYFLY
jgi:hypothetical protein